MTLTDPQEKAMRRFREGWTAKRKRQEGGFKTSAAVRLLPPGGGRGEEVSVVTLRALVAKRLVEVETDEEKRSWRVVS